MDLSKKRLLNYRIPRVCAGLVGMALMFFIVAHMVQLFGICNEYVLIIPTHTHFSCCRRLLTLSHGVGFSSCAGSKEAGRCQSQDGWPHWPTMLHTMQPHGQQWKGGGSCWRCQLAGGEQVSSASLVGFWGCVVFLLAMVFVCLLSY